MKESMWAMFVVSIGIVSVAFVFFFQSMTNTDEHNYHLLKEATEAAMYDAFDLAAYRVNLTIRIDKEKFVENFIRRFAENASLTRTYRVRIYDVNEEPPKVSLQVASTEQARVNEIMDFNIINRLDAILETPYGESSDSLEEDEDIE